MDMLLSYVWYAVVVAVYIALSYILLLLNKRWKWIYGNSFIEKLPLNSDHPVKLAGLYPDSGLTVVLALLGPVLALISLVFLLGLWTIRLFMTLCVTFPRYLLNR